MKKITTKTVGRGFAESSLVPLELTPETYLYFKPGIHTGGVRGYLVRAKKEKAKTWEGVKEIDFKKVGLEPGMKVEIELSTEALEKLVQAVEENRQIIGKGIARGEQEYVVEKKEKVLIVDDKTKREIFESLMTRGYTSEFWELLRESEPELATSLSVGHLYAEKKRALAELEERLKGTYPETNGDDSWQSWIYREKWLFGVNYTNTIQKARVNFAGSMPDYLFLTADNFVDVLEIKLPEKEAILDDSSHSGSYRWSGETNEAIGQVVSYVDSIERNQDALEKEILRVYKIRVSCVKPRGFILIGKKTGWDEFKRAGLRRLNAALHGVEVLTYTDLLQRGKEIAEMYRHEAEEAKPVVD